jgi:hypothetical protein
MDKNTAIGHFAWRGAGHKSLLRLAGQEVLGRWSVGGEPGESLVDRRGHMQACAQSHYVLSWDRTDLACEIMSCVLSFGEDDGVVSLTPRGPLSRRDSPAMAISGDSAGGWPGR